MCLLPNLYFIVMQNESGELADGEDTHACMAVWPTFET